MLLQHAEVQAVYGYSHQHGRAYLKDTLLIEGLYMLFRSYVDQPFVGHTFLASDSVNLLFVGHMSKNMTWFWYHEQAGVPKQVPQVVFYPAHAGVCAPGDSQAGNCCMQGLSLSRRCGDACLHGLWRCQSALQTRHGCSTRCPTSTALWRTAAQ